MFSRNNGDEILIYANIPYHTSEMNTSQTDNNQTMNYQTTSMRASYYQKSMLVNLVKQKLINILQAIEMTNVNTPPFFMNEVREPAFDITDFKLWLLLLIIGCSISTLISIVVLILKLNTVLP